MKSKKNEIIILLAVFVVSGLLFLRCLQWQQSPVAQPAKGMEAAVLVKANTLPINFFDQERFDDAMKNAEQTPEISGCKIKGGIIPHHLLASRIITGLFQDAIGQDIQNIIIIGPNHFEKGSRIITNGSDWRTPVGVVETDQTLVRELLKSKIAVSSDEIMQSEFSTTSILPFVRHYFPETKVVQIILKRQIDREKMVELSAILGKYLQDERNIMIAAIDFSHYLTLDEAQEKDSETWRHIDEYDFEAINNLSNDYVDSPSSLMLELMTMKKIGIEKPQLAENLNSTQITGQNSNSTTSYFSIRFCR